MKTGLKIFLAILVSVCFLSCEKNEIIEIDSLFGSTKKMAYSSQFSNIINTPLKANSDLDPFSDGFLGNWHVLEVVTLNPLGQWIYLDYSNHNLEYSFLQDCRYFNPDEMYCRFESTHITDPSGVFEIRLEDNTQKLYLKSDLSDLTLDESYWGNVYHWPSTPDLLIVHKPEAPFWIIMERVFVD